MFQIIEKSPDYSFDPEFSSDKKEKTKKNYSRSQFSSVPQNDKVLKDLVRELSRINTSNKRADLDDFQDLENKLIKTKQKSNELKNQLHNLQKNFNSETQNLNQEIQNLKEQNRFR